MHDRLPSLIRRALPALALAAVAYAPSVADAKGQDPADLLKGRVIISDKRPPTRWSSAAGYASQLKAMNRESLWLDKKTGKLTVEYAAFFAKPVNDVQVDLVIYDVTNRGQRDQKATTENFMTRGERALFASVTLDKEDFPINRKYMLVLQSRGQPIASGTFILRGEGEHYSGKVSFTDDETKAKE